MNDPHAFELRKLVVPELIFGEEARLLAGRYCRNLGIRKALVVTDPGVEGAGWTANVVESLRDEGIDAALFRGVSSNPRAGQVMAGAEAYAAESCNGLVAVGGGSPMDCAKGIGICAESGGRNILEFEGVDEVPVTAPPLVCVPTTAGTAADISQFAIFTDTARKVKIAVVSKRIVPDAALIDPVTTMTMPPYLTACTAMDALCHGIEAYVSTATSAITDLHALEAIRIIRNTLLPVLEHPNSYRYRGKMMLASLHAGIAFSNASLGAVHALAHSVGGFLDFTHGEANAILLEPVIAYNFGAAAGRYREVADAMGLTTKGMPDDEVRDALVDMIHRLRVVAGLGQSLGGLGLSAENIPALAENAIRDPCLATNPRTPTLREIEAIYEAAL